MIGQLPPSAPGIYAIWLLGDAGEERKIYIGQTRSLLRRRLEHIHSLKKGNHPSIHLRRAWQKHGPSLFRFDVLEQEPFSRSEMIAHEEEWMRLAIAEFGRKGLMNRIVRGHHLSEETRSKISRALTGRKMPEEIKAKISAWNKAHPPSAEARARMSIWKKGSRPDNAPRLRVLNASRRGIPLTAEHRAKVGAASKGRVLSAGHRAKIGASKIGKPRSAETKAKLSAAIKGTRLSLKTRLRMSAARRRSLQNTDPRQLSLGGMW